MDLPVAGGAAPDQAIMLDGLMLAPAADGGLSLLNESAGVVLASLRSGRGEQGAAEALATRYGIAPERAARDAGVAARQLRACGIWPSGKERGCRAAACTLVDATWRFDRVLAPLGEPVRVRVAGSQLARAVAGVVGAEAQDGELGPSVATLVAQCGRGLWLDGRQVLSGGSLMLLRSELIRLLLLASGRRRRWLAILHAAAVSDGRAVVLLSGSSGSGKSTLAARLAVSGLSFVTDDYAPLEAGTCALWPTPFGLSAKAGSWDLLAPLLPGLAAQDTIRTRGRAQRYVEPPRRETAPRRVACLVFPMFQAGGPCRLEPLRPAEALTLVTHGGGWFESTPERLRELAAWFGRTPAYALSYGDGEAVAAIVRDLLARHAAAAGDA